ncbi:signal peptidase I [Kitasatospora sp. NPDC088548]|uniref:signal peptidase I n=1 Tax=Kitasatospora sp. NPDC088548 TaxID=3364075 RepID=UPI00382D51B6
MALVTGPGSGRPKRWPLWTSAGVAAAGLLTAVLGLVLVAFDYSPRTLQSGGMSPTLKPGGRILTETVRASEVRRGDVVLVESPWTMSGLIVKRVVGLGGDRVTCRADGPVTVNGQPLTEPYTYDGSPNGNFPAYTATVPPGRVFLLGDYRAESVDSRMFLDDQQGTVAAADVRERVVWHSGGSEPLPVGLVAPLAAVGGGGLLLAAGVIGFVAAAVLRSRRRAGAFTG